MMVPSSVAAGTRMAGAFMRNVQTLLTSPASGATNTSSTVTLQAKNLDPFRRAGKVVFQMDRTRLFNSAEAQTSSAVVVTGWADTAASWASAAAGNGGYWYRARSDTVKIGAGPSLPIGRYAAPVAFIQAGGAGIARSLYLYENKSISPAVAAVGTDARALYLYVNKSIWARTAAVGTNARALYTYVNKAVAFTPNYTRALYLYESPKDLPVIPWLMSIAPTQQYPLGTVDLYGDGLGQYTEVAGASTATASTTNGGNIPANAIARTSQTNIWQSTEASPWLRLTFGAAQTIYAVDLEDVVNASANRWGTPLFRFSDAGADVVGGSAAPIPVTLQRSTEFPVGTVRTRYVLPVLRTGITWVEVRVSSGGAGTARGLSQVWIYADQGQNAETSVPLLNALTMGAPFWSGRSPGLWPANGGQPITIAATVVVPAIGVSGLVKVQES